MFLDIRKAEESLNRVISDQLNHAFSRDYTDKKEIENFLRNKEIQMGSVSKSYMRKGFLIYEEMSKYLTIYEESVSHK